MYMAAMVLPSMAQPLAFKPPLLMERRLSGMMSAGSNLHEHAQSGAFFAGPVGDY